MICQEIRDSDGNGGQILSIMGCGVARFQGETVESAKSGQKMAPDKECADVLKRVLFLYLRHMRGSRKEVNSKVYSEGSPQ